MFLHKYLLERSEFVLSKQVLRSGTSIGANISEAVRAESDKDFIHKLSISRKECSETLYWIELLHRSEYITAVQYESIKNDCEELLKILTAIILSSKKRRKLKHLIRRDSKICKM